MGFGEGLGPGKQAAEDSVKHSCHKMQRREGYWEHLSIKKGEKKKGEKNRGEECGNSSEKSCQDVCPEHSVAAHHIYSSFSRDQSPEIRVTHGGNGEVYPSSWVCSWMCMCVYEAGEGVMDGHETVTQIDTAFINI